MRSLVILGMVFFAGEAAAACYGSDSYQTCYDAQSGNNYTVQRYGNTTTMYGSNAETGSTWSQQSYSFGNSTTHYGQDSRGNNWSQTCVNGTCY